MKKLAYLVLGFLWIVGILSMGIVEATATITSIDAPNASTCGLPAGSMRGIQFDDGNGHVIKMLDRNVGACLLGTGENAYGYYFQWGNNRGFTVTEAENNLYEVSDSEVNMGANLVQWQDSFDAHGYYGSTFIKSIWEPYGGDFWKDGNYYSSNHENIWGGGRDYENGRGGQSNNPVVGRKGPCPEGYHVPSQAEWDNLIKYYVQSYDGWDSMFDVDVSNDYGEFIASYNNLAIDFANDFKLPYGGYIDTDKKTVSEGIEYRNGGVLGYYWSSSPNSRVDPTSRVFILGANMLWNQSDSMRTQGYNIRCFYDESVEEYEGSFTITFDSMGGTDVASQTVQSNETLEEPAEPTKEGYTFIGWYEKGVTEQFDFSVPITRNIKLYAHRNLLTNATITEISAPWAYQNSFKMGGIKFDDGNGYSVKILDRNLGAFGGINTYGLHYQWGNNYGFDGQCSCPAYNGYQTCRLGNSVGISARSPNCYDYSSMAQLYDPYSYDHKGIISEYFIKSSWEPYRLDYWNDSSTVNHEKLRGGEGDYDNDWGLTSTNDVTWRQGPCPRGYHVPSQGERNELFTHWWMAYSGKYDEYQGITYKDTDYGARVYYDVDNNKIIQDFQNDFNITFDGYRDGEDGAVKGKGEVGYYWTSSPNTASEALSRKFTITPSGIYSDSDSARAYGYSVRCFYDPDPAKYYAYFYDNGTQIGSIAFIEGGESEGEIPTVATRDGYTFGGWTNGRIIYSTLTTNAIESAIRYPSVGYGPQDVSFAVQWTPINYYITYNLNGGELADGVTNPSTYNINSYITLNNPTRIGYDFIGWSGTNIAGTSQSVTIYGGTGNRNYEANWEAIEYTLTIDLGDGRIQTITGHYGDPITQPQDPTRDGYTFAGWNPSFPITMPAENTTITAQRTEIETYTLTIDLGDGRTQTITGHYGDPITQPQDPTRDGYTFAGWNPSFPTTMPAENMEIKAVWEKLSQPSGGGGGGSGGGSSGGGSGRTSTKTDTNTGVINTGDAINNPKDIENNKDDNKQDNVLNNGYSEEFVDAYEFAHKNGITTQNSITNADMDGNLTRIAMAKMLSQYAINILGMKPDVSRVNRFNDISDELDGEYGGGVTLAYQLGIMGINMPNNKFRPFDLVPRAEFITALSRLLYHTIEGEHEGTSEYYVPHINKLKDEKIITNIDPWMLEVRGYVMIMLMRAAGE